MRAVETVTSAKVPVSQPTACELSGTVIVACDVRMKA